MICSLLIIDFDSKAFLPGRKLSFFFRENVWISNLRNLQHFTLISYSHFIASQRWSEKKIHSEWWSLKCAWHTKANSAALGKWCSAVGPIILPERTTGFVCPNSVKSPVISRSPEGSKLTWLDLKMILGWIIALKKFALKLSLPTMSQNWNPDEWFYNHHDNRFWEVEK